MSRLVSALTTGDHPRLRPRTIRMYAARLPPALSANSDTTQQYLYMQASAQSAPSAQPPPPRPLDSLGTDARISARALLQNDMGLDCSAYAVTQQYERKQFMRYSAPYIPYGFQARLWSKLYVIAFFRRRSLAAVAAEPGHRRLPTPTSLVPGGHTPASAATRSPRRATNFFACAGRSSSSTAALLFLPSCYYVPPRPVSSYCQATHACSPGRAAAKDHQADRQPNNNDDGGGLFRRHAGGGPTPPGGGADARTEDVPASHCIRQQGAHVRAAAPAAGHHRCPSESFISSISLPTHTICNQRSLSPACGSSCLRDERSAHHQLPARSSSVVSPQQAHVRLVTVTAQPDGPSSLAAAAERLRCGC